MKNAGNLLPLAKNTKVAVIGPAADAFPQSTIAGSGAVNPSTKVTTPLAGIRAAIGDAKVNYAQGSVGTGSLPLLVARHTESGTVVGNADLLTSDAAGNAGFNETITDEEGTPLVSNVAYEIELRLVLRRSRAVQEDRLAHRTRRSLGRQPEELEGRVQGRSQGGEREELPVFSDRLRYHATLHRRPTRGAGAVDGVGHEELSLPLDLRAEGHAIDLLMDTSSYGWPLRFGVVTQPPTLKLTWSPAGDMMQDALALAKGAEVAVVFVSDAQTEGVDHGASLPGDQDVLVSRVAALAKKTVVVLNTGSALVLPWADRVDAVLENWYGGEEMGTAIAALLFGDANPSGKLVVTFPASEAQLYARSASEYPGTKAAGDGYPTVDYDEGIFVGYRHFDQTRQDPLFPFGHGLSYTNFAYSELRVTRMGEPGVRSR